MNANLAGDPAPTNPDRLVLSTGQEYADAICEIAVLARGENPDRLIALVGAALRYIEANTRTKALAEAADRAKELRQFDAAWGARKSAQVSENVGVLRVADELRRMAVDGGESR
jgi:mannitol-1-phosphate/altronate dehydrogenase